jgi:hypothetical protein
MPGEREVDEQDIVTKPRDELAAQAEDISARGSARFLESLHGGSPSLPDYGQTARREGDEDGR